MKVEFNGKSKKKVTGVSHSYLEKGDYEDIVKHRESHLPKIEAEVQKVLANYHGQGIALIVLEEDENGNATGVRSLISGVGRPSGQMQLAKALVDGGQEVIDLLVKSIAKESPEEALDLAMEIAKLIDRK